MLGMPEIPDSTQTKPPHKIEFAAYPAAGYKPETSFLLGAVGIAVFNQSTNLDKRFYRPATITPYFFYTFRKQFLTYLDMEMFPHNKYYFNGTFRYWNYPDLYFGIGNKTTGANELYIDRFIKYEARLSRIINEKLLLGLAFQWQYNRLSNINKGGFLDTARLAGKKGGNVFALGPELRFDNRDNTLYPTRGYYVEAFGLFNPEWALSNYRFNIYGLDARAFTHLFSIKNILALQAYYLSTQGKEIPFYMLPKLGGDQRLRGIEHENRYTDKQAYYIQAEGRRHLFWRLGGVLFIGLGDVNQSMKDFSLTSLKFIYGIGGRFQPIRSEKLNIRLDAGKGPGKQYAIYFSLNEAF